MSNYGLVGFCTVVILLALADSAAAREPGLEAPPLGDRRRPVSSLRDDPALVAAASAVALIEIESSAEGGAIVYSDFGSGFLVSKCVVVTARHVLGLDARSPGRRELKISLRFGLDGSAEKAPRPIEAKVVAYGGEAGRTRGEISDDWAILRLTQAPEPSRPLALNAGVVASAKRQPEFMMLGFPLDHFDKDRPVMWADRPCGLREILPNGMIATSCLATSGNSGAPLLQRRQDGGWSAAGILVRADEPTGVATAVAGKNYSLPIDRYLNRRISDEIHHDPCEAPAAAQPDTSKP